MGSAKERELSNLLEDRGWAVMRSGGSGSGTTRARPDLIAGRGGERYWVIEEKYRGSSKQCYIEAEEAQMLLDFATRFGAEPIVMVRYSTRLDGVAAADWRVSSLGEVRTLENGNLALNHSEACEWPLLDDILTAIESD